MIPVLWVVLTLAAAVFRLTDLAAAPLGPSEAEQALPAYLAAQGTRDVAWQGAPLLLHLNTLLFALFGGRDELARLAPALAGLGLVLTPLLFQRYLGPWGALGMGLLLAFSPLHLFFSRTLDGTTFAALGTMLLVGSIARYLDTWQPSLIILGGAALGMALTAGAGTWGLLLGPALALAAGLWIWRDQVEWIWTMVRPLLGRGLAAASLTALALGTGLGLNPAGLSGIGEAFLGWLRRFGLPPETTPPSPFFLLLAYEPLILLAGLAGLVFAARRRHGLGLLWAFWAVTSALQLSFMPGRKGPDLLWLLLPLAGLGGLAIETLARSLEAHGRWQNEGLHLPISLILWAHCGLTLARYARLGNPADRLLSLLTLLLQLLLTAAFGFAVSAPEPEEEPAQATQRGLATAIRAGGLSLGLALLALTISTGWRLSHIRPADPRERIIQETTAVEVRTLVEVVKQISVQNTGIETGLPILFLGQPDPALAWALRHFEQQTVGRLEPGDSPPLVVASAEEIPPPGYFGEIFALKRAWSPGWGGPETVRWWLYRETSTLPVVTEQVTLWVREDLGTTNNTQ